MRQNIFDRSQELRRIAKEANHGGGWTSRDVEGWISLPGMILPFLH